jgi:hypothetical protein
MLIREPIVLFFALYSAYICTSSPSVVALFCRSNVRRLRSADGLLYGCFSAIPWVYHDDRGWASSIGSLPFISIGVGILAGVLANYFFNRSYLETLRAASGQLPPEARLPLCVLGGVALPLGFMVFAWTTLPQVHWIVSVVSIAPFGFAIAAVFLSMTVSPLSPQTDPCRRYRLILRPRRHCCFSSPTSSTLIPSAQRPPSAVRPSLAVSQALPSPSSCDSS